MAATERLLTARTRNVGLCRRPHLLHLVTVFYVFNAFTVFGQAQLVVNVKNAGGDLIQETIKADTTQDVITVDFQKLDGTLIKIILDFHSEVQITRLTVLGEEERNEKLYQRLCFVNHFTKNSFISTDAMSKLRQKNPGTVRNPEEDLGREQLQMDMGVNLERAFRISKHIRDACSEARTTTYTREMDLKLWSKGKKAVNLFPHFAGTEEGVNATYTTLSAAVQKQPFATTASRCRDTVDFWKPCVCHIDVCIGWYPCGLKYCRGRDSAGNNVNYRCGIKTCKKCRGFDYYITQKSLCLWDNGNR
ncbi:Out at first protein [Holothuria leucospilota]|uniref:Out at first protein n=1 Tax=Holothuria leucospilota TaxID=206669 RepID=A0A9Q1BYV9_HOLLE|nr:Out at first protein [Holothuria leucospilota]